jgi:hypothetical protein
MWIVPTVAGAAIASGSTWAAMTFADSSTPSTIRLHGWVMWTESMPLSYTVETSNSPFPLYAPVPYTPSKGRAICAGDLSRGQAASSANEIVVRGSDGHLLTGVQYVDVGTLHSQQDARQADLSNDSAGDFTCLVGWHTPPIERQPAYTVSLHGKSAVVSATDASRAIYLSA